MLHYFNTLINKFPKFSQFPKNLIIIEVQNLNQLILASNDKIKFTTNENIKRIENNIFDWFNLLAQIENIFENENQFNQIN